MRDPKRRSVDVRAVARFVVRSTRRALLTLAGFGLVCLGLAGLILPVLPGWVLIIGGFAVLSREYSWADSCLAYCRRQAARSGSKVKTMVAQRRGRATAADLEVVLPSDDVVIDLTTATSAQAEVSSFSDRRSARG